MLPLKFSRGCWDKIIWTCRNCRVNKHSSKCWSWIWRRNQSRLLIWIGNVSFPSVHILSCQHNVLFQCIVLLYVWILLFNNNLLWTHNIAHRYRHTHGTERVNESVLSRLSVVLPLWTRGKRLFSVPIIIFCLNLFLYTVISWYVLVLFCCNLEPPKCGDSNKSFFLKLTSDSVEFLKNLLLVVLFY